MNQKRIRSCNWEEEEKRIFRAVLKEYAQFIENKALDTNAIKRKNKAWEEVHKKFNELNSRHRQLSQLKIKWKIMKLHARKKNSTKPTEPNKTGDGSRPTTPNDAVTEIKDPLSVELLDHNECDLDSIDQDNYVKSMLSHSKMLKDKEHRRRMEMAEEEHAIKMAIHKENLAIHKEKLNCVILEKEILQCKKDQDNYVKSMLSHSKMLKDKEHRRRMEMAEEEHAIKMAIHKENLAIHKEKLNCVILEKEILQCKKVREMKL